jgi:uncharacterized protein (DUF488 family)
MPPRDKPSTILTIGHSTRTIAGLIELLRAHDVHRVVDVRTIPRSRHNPQFNREELSAALRKAKIGSVHLKNLGGLRHANRDSVNLGWRNASFRGFADYMQTAEFQTGLARLIELARAKRTAILCAEVVHWRCHRSLIADALVVRKIPVEHILSTSRREAHSMTSFARVRGGKITYPENEETRQYALKMDLVVIKLCPI